MIAWGFVHNDFVWETFLYFEHQCGIMIVTVSLKQLLEIISSKKMKRINQFQFYLAINFKFYILPFIHSENNVRLLGFLN